MHVGPSQAGPKENEEAGLPSVWFEYDDGKHFLRQAVALDDDRAVSLVLVDADRRRAQQLRRARSSRRCARCGR